MENVVENALEVAKGGAARPQRDGSTLKGVEAADVVQSQAVVRVTVRDEKRVNARDSVAQGLDAEVRGDVDLEAEALRAYVNAAAVAPVARIG